MHFHSVKVVCIWRSHFQLYKGENGKLSGNIQLLLIGDSDNWLGMAAILWHGLNQKFCSYCNIGLVLFRSPQYQNFIMFVYLPLKKIDDSDSILTAFTMVNFWAKHILRLNFTSHKLSLIFITSINIQRTYLPQFFFKVQVQSFVI